MLIRSPDSKVSVLASSSEVLVGESVKRYNLYDFAFVGWWERDMVLVHLIEAEHHEVLITKSSNK